MAIQFGRVEIVKRSEGGNACCKSAYNARSKIKDDNTNVTYNFTKHGDNVYHDVLLPENADIKFKDIAVLMNAVEAIENRKDSQLLKDVVIALPDDKELNLKDRIEITKRIIDKQGWVKNGLAVQVDIHKPHDGEKNWHAHLLVATRRFTEDGKSFGLKARDLNPEFKNSGKSSFIVPEDSQLQHDVRDVINDYFKELGLENRVDAISLNPGEHIGPVRMRSVFNAAEERNKERRVADIEYLTDGVRLLDRVTNSASVFSRKDLERAVKIVPSREMQRRLVEDALSQEGLISLYDDKGNKTGFYTTSEIREEEHQLVRLSNYIVARDNLFSGLHIEDYKHLFNLIEESKSSLSEEQHKALSKLLLNKSGLRILRGRAGVGKSYVLGKVCSIAESCGVNVIGVAPTHKAKIELTKIGYEKTETVKGLLFKMYNGRFHLPKGSLIVVDEAGMVGNDDYKELLRIAASRKCNVILSGDERQLASVSRGGMFEVLADKYGSSTILNIKRQKEEWARSVAQDLSSGRVTSAIKTMLENKRIIEHSSREEAMYDLLQDWSTRNSAIGDRLILAVKNKDVAALNHGARQHLKVDRRLKGREYSIAGNHYMKGDRILITQTNKELGLCNGDRAKILEISKDRVLLRMRGDKPESEEWANDNARYVEFNPSEYSGFRHGYATTVFKSQGASIKDVYIFHDGYAGIRNSYVALSRCVEDMRLYINHQATKSMSHLSRQLGYDIELGSSLNYVTKEELQQLETEAKEKESQSILGSVLSSAMHSISTKITELKDKHLPDIQYYKFEVPQIAREQVEEVLETIGRRNEENEQGVESKKVEVVETVQAKVVGGMNAKNQVVHAKDNHTRDSVVESPAITENNSNYSKNRQTPKSRFYAQADKIRSLSRREEIRGMYKQEEDKFKYEVKFKAEQIARDILGAPNRKMSSGKTLRFGSNGKIAVRIAGEKMGSWYDFSTDKGGDMFSFVQENRNCDFIQASKYLRQVVGMEMRASLLSIVSDHNNWDRVTSHVKERREELKQQKKKEEYVGKLWNRSKAVGNASIAYKYLDQHRVINCDVGDYVKTTGVSVKKNISRSIEAIKGDKVFGVDSEIESTEGSKYYPALIAFAKDMDGNITGGQQIILDRNTYGKANIAVPKKSFGKIAGSFVDLTSSASQGQEKEFGVTIIAEGLETALSVKQALVKSEHIEKKEQRSTKYKTLCSLGISNIKNYEPKQGEKIIIAADNDGKDSNTAKLIKSSVETLREKGAFVSVVQPEHVGDFNDVLRSQLKVDQKGEQEINRVFRPEIAKLTANTVKEYVEVTGVKLGDAEKAAIGELEQYNIDQSNIVDCYRRGDTEGVLALMEKRKELEDAFKHYNNYKQILNKAEVLGNDNQRQDIIKSITGMDGFFAEKHIINVNLRQFASRAEKENTLESAMKMLDTREMFLGSLYGNLPHADKYQSASLETMKSAHIGRGDNGLENLERLASFISSHPTNKVGVSADDMMKIMNKSNVIKDAYNSVLHNYQHHILNQVNYGIKTIEDGTSIKMDGKHFDCPIKFLDHVTGKDKHQHEFFPAKEVHKIKTQQLELQKQLHLSHQLDGPDL